jgi:hypothetical protein
MPLRRTIGISLACFVTSACAMGETPEESPSHILDEATAIPQSDPEPAIDGSRTQFGEAAWYNFVGKKTASGEILDTVTPTAAHLSLPLASYAKVTNLDNSRSVIVKINDRGPYGRRTHRRPLALCCRSAGHEARWGGGRRHRTFGL